MMPGHPSMLPTHPESSRLTEERQDTEAKIDGLKIVLAMALDMLPEGEVRERLRLLEETSRQRNLPIMTIAVVQEFCEKWEA
jgi:hypothetical protein